MSTPPPWPPSPPPPPAPVPPPMPPGIAAGAPAYAPYYPPPQPKKSSAAPIIVILIVVIVGGLFVTGIIAAIAIPSFLRARSSANEAAAINTLRTIVSAEVTWSQTHEGRYAQPACLAAPDSCGDPQTPALVMKEIAGLGVRSGYAFGFLLKPDAPEPARDAGSSDGTSDAGAEAAAEPGVSLPGAPSDAEVRAQLEQFSTPDNGASPSLAAPPPPEQAAVARLERGFILWAAPTQPGRTGSRRFCVDETGEIRTYGPDAGWTTPAVDAPRCPDASSPLR